MSHWEIVQLPMNIQVAQRETVELDSVHAAQNDGDSAVN